MNKRVSNRVAAIQMVSGHDIDANLREAEQLLARAAEQGASVAVLPENFAVLATSQMIDRGRQEAGSEPVIRTFLAEQARQLGLWIVGGSMPVAKRPDGSDLEDRVRATCIVFDDQGKEVARYDKIHLFDAMVEDAHGQYRESDTFEPGEQIVTVDTPAGKLGLAICYDLRFPELFRLLREQEVDWICLPSAFTWQTGDAHWYPLIRARAIENQCMVIGLNRAGVDGKNIDYPGSSGAWDALGESLVGPLDDREQVATFELDFAAQDEIRKKFPFLPDRDRFSIES